MPPTNTKTLDEGEVAQFDAIADEWWDPTGKFAPLHKLGPARLTFLRDALCDHFKRDASTGAPLAGLRIVDVGCGGGLISEPLARLGADVVGLDPSGEGIESAKAHAAAMDLEIDYRVSRIEDLVEAGERFDAVVCLEVIEHVPDQAGFVKALTGVLPPSGLLVMSTLNRNLKSYALAIVAAERILGWVPAGTHDWDKFVTPDELDEMMVAAALRVRDVRGLVYNPLRDTWSLSDDTDVNYMMSAALDA